MDGACVRSVRHPWWGEMTYVTPGVKGNTIDRGAQVDRDQRWAQAELRYP
jgi:hypothetical protein